MNYSDAVNLLTSQSKFQIRPGLERTLSILNLFENPQNKIKIIHIAGTNGKGSVACVLANILKNAGYKTGLYTSPHLKEYTERIKINGEDITETDFSEYIEKVCNKADKYQIDLTEFEILTTVMYLYFYEKKIDIAIIETGLGGRFDATNTANDKLLSIITSISLDHTDRLGKTIEKIAFEKAGIINENSNLIISSQNAGFNTIKNICNEKNTKLFISEDNIKTLFENGKNYLIYNGKKYDFNLLGLYQNENMALVLSAVKFLQKSNFNISDSDIENGLKNAVWKARLEYIKNKNILLDGAHNPNAAMELKKSLDYYFRNKKRIFIYSTINTKDYKSVAKALFKPDDKIFYYEFNHKNAVLFEEYIKNVDWLKNIEKIDKNSLKNILDLNGLKIITGSLYMIGEIYKLNLFDEL